MKLILLRIISYSLILWNASINSTLAGGWISFHCGHILPSIISLFWKPLLKKHCFLLISWNPHYACGLCMQSGPHTNVCWLLLLSSHLLPIDFQGFGITMCAVSEPLHAPGKWHRLNCTVCLCLDEHLCNLWISRAMSSPVQNAL